MQPSDGHYMKVFKIPPHPDNHFCEELYAMEDTSLGSVGRSYS